MIAIENVRLFKELKESLEQQTATSEILGVIASSPKDVQPVLDVVAENAARLCDATDAVIHRIDGDKLRSGARYGLLPTRRGSEPLTSIDRGSIPGRTVIDRRILHIHDLAAEPEDDLLAPFARSLGVRTVLATPLLREGIPIGTIHIRRMEVRPFTEKQIKLLETFAAQAVIAIENVRLFQELKESLEQQTATSEILGVIASSPTDIQPVLDAVAKNAARLCEATDAQIRLVEGEETRLAASFGILPAPEFRPVNPRTPSGRAILTRDTVHIHDLQKVKNEFPESEGLRRGLRTFLSEPMLREGTAIGAINIRRMEVRPFSDKHIKLLKTFASQAVIAIENVRLFKELQERNAELREALEHQTATAEVLGIISRSPTDVQPVLDAIVESAARVCGTDDVLLRLQQGNMLTVRAHFGSIPIGRAEVSVDEPTFLWIRQHGTLHIQDTRAALNDFPMLGSVGWRSWFAVPLRQQGQFIGTLGARRIEVRPFTPAQMKLLETFADQAVIAIENVRLFKELQERNRDLTEALEQQTATSEILRAIANSPTEIQPVLDVIAENAARICETPDVSICRVEDDAYRVVAIYGSAPNWTAGETRPLDRSSVIGRAIVDRQTIHLHDVRTVQDDFWRVVQQGLRTMLATPLLREGVAIGAIGIRRTEVQPFTEKQIALLKTFADQAVIAIENVRLFQELKESLEQQTATSEILGVIASSPTDLQPVLDTIAENAARVCAASDAVIGRLEGDNLEMAANYGSMPYGLERYSLTRGFPTARAILDRQTIHVHDILAEIDTEYPEARIPQQLTGTRTLLAVPLLREGNPIGVIVIRRREVRPFSEKQVKLLETFADQAVIAIENVRLFQGLKESLEQQTATSEIFGVIASSPTDLQPVLDTIAKSAARICRADDVVIRLVERDGLRLAAHHGSIRVEVPVRPIDRNSAVGRAVFDRAVIHIEDLLAIVEKEFPATVDISEHLGIRTMLAAPLMRENQPTGVIIIRRMVVEPFSEKQIALLKTFADQAVIAIENVRLFQELEARTSELAGSVGESKRWAKSAKQSARHWICRLCLARSLAMRSSSRGLLGVLFTSSMRRHKSFCKGELPY